MGGSKNQEESREEQQCKQLETEKFYTKECNSVTLVQTKVGCFINGLCTDRRRHSDTLIYTDRFNNSSDRRRIGFSCYNGTHFQLEGVLGLQVTVTGYEEEDIFTVELWFHTLDLREVLFYGSYF